ncbi:ribose-5-phosphate isomerase RpiA [soil metagenome]
MAEASSGKETARHAAAARAAGLVAADMKLGLGTGSTAAVFVALLAWRVREEGLALVCAATSAATEALALREGLACRPLEALGRLDLTVDGADEVDGALRLIKGGGGALLREKIVAHASDRMVVIADAAKRVAVLGAFPLPVEVVRFAAPVTRGAVERMLERADVDGREVTLRRREGAPLVTDEGHHILELRLRRIGDPAALAAALAALPGVVEHGLFLGMAKQAIFGHADGGVETATARGEPGLTPGEARAFAEDLTRSIEA